MFEQITESLLDLFIIETLVQGLLGARWAIHLTRCLFSGLAQQQNLLWLQAHVQELLATAPVQAAVHVAYVG